MRDRGAAVLLQVGVAAVSRRELAKHGLSYTDDKGMIRARPECSIERTSQIAFLRAVRELNLQVKLAAASRPAPKRTVQSMSKPFAPEIIRLFKLANEILDAGADEKWEPAGRRREFSDTSVALHAALGREPWQRMFSTPTTTVHPAG
jgi:hypothetical protein